MAGIAGLVRSGATPDKIETMLDVLRHRGPADRWCHTDAGCALGVCTAELGREKGTGYAVRGKRIALFDGEIYNERVPETPDVEVVLEMYERHGRTFGAHLHGVFACAVWDDGQLVLTRDAVGVRPLYWGRDANGVLAFASELKALVGRVSEVHELHPATAFSSQAGIQSYVPVYPPIQVPDSVEDAKRALRDALFRATERRLKDGAVGGMLLSGGLDSSIIAAIANEIKPGLPAFTVGIEGAPDLENAALMAEHLGVAHHVRLFGKAEILTLIPKAVNALESFDEDCVSGAIANLVASELAHEHTNCILSGEGGDELNGGYLLLKDLPDEESRRRMMERLIAVAYNTAVQRLDRAMMANRITYRTPFIDSEVIAFCLQMPVDWKVHDTGNGRFIEKWLLREAFKEMLPEKIYRREKLRFSGGTGTDPLIEAIGDQLPSAQAFSEETRRTPAGYTLNSPKELYYYRLFKEAFPDPAFEPLVGRWDPGK